MSTKAFLILEDGSIFKGSLFGHEGETMGEVVFNTSMSGYQEVLTDPSYCGQVISMTYPMIGNYGVNEEDVESDKVQVAGFAVKEYAKQYSNFRATCSLDEYLKKNRVTAIEGIDTRKLTRHIRDKGALRGGIFLRQEEAIDRLKAHPQMNGLDLASRVMTGVRYNFGTHTPEKPLIGVFDFGVKTNILRMLDAAGFSVRVYPGNTELKEVLSENVKGVFLSNGPGDPDAVEYGKTLVRDIAKESVPCFGICLGHQLMALGLGARTYKLKFGHRGGNQPVKNLDNGNVEITSQNHGFAVDNDSLKQLSSSVRITHMNLNDNTVEGIEHKNLPMFSVQYHPEAAPGPHDAAYLFDKFKAMVG